MSRNRIKIKSNNASIYLNFYSNKLRETNNEKENKVWNDKFEAIRCLFVFIWSYSNYMKY